jgi:hypothetical protein
MKLAMCVVRKGKREMHGKFNKNVREGRILEVGIS